MTTEQQGGSGTVPVERWIPEPPFDSADYLDRPDYHVLPDETETDAEPTGEGDGEQAEA